MRSLDQLLRKHILAVKPYASARSEYTETAKTASTQVCEANVFLDANENAFGSPAALAVSRYPDPLQISLKQRIGAIKGLPESGLDPIQTLFLGNGSDEPIDLLLRAFCEPMPENTDKTTHEADTDNIIITPPTYGMYEVSAAIHNVRVRRVPLRKDAAGFHLVAEEVLAAVTPRTKIIFLCSPNNPTGNSLDPSAIERIITGFDGIVVIDEAYIDFAPEQSFLSRLHLAAFRHVVVLQTFSKAWGMAALRLGMAFAAPEIIAVLNKIKAPYNINSLAQEAALTALSDHSWKDRTVAETVHEREHLADVLREYTLVRRVYPSDANFLLVEMDNARRVYEELVYQGVVVRDRSATRHCEDCLRITVGTREENTRLLSVLGKIDAAKGKEE
ncbi:MAG: histidinol-phosphate transaminase [Candidatus Kapaibacterium sp.]|nr:MAG: histidinol-phosphate transaminase [Candidatus Kapabacteria bacterium]